MCSKPFLGPIKHELDSRLHVSHPAPLMKLWPFADGEDQYQTAQNVDLSLRLVKPGGSFSSTTSYSLESS